MFGIGLPELFIILIIALVVLGPDKLPDLARAIGKGIGEFRRATDEIKESFQADDDLKKLKDTLSEAKNEMSQFVREETKDLDAKDLIDNIKDGAFFDTDSNQADDETDPASRPDDEGLAEDTMNSESEDRQTPDPARKRTEPDSNR